MHASAQGRYAEALAIAARALTALMPLPDAGPVVAMFRMRRGAALFGISLRLLSPTMYIFRKLSVVCCRQQACRGPHTQAKDWDFSLSRSMNHAEFQTVLVIVPVCLLQPWGRRVLQ